MKKQLQNISIAGCIGAGKSMISKELEKEGYQIVSAGSLFRQYAKEHNISIEEAISGHTEIDTEIDSNIVNLGETKSGIVFDSRMAWHFVPDSFKVFVYADLDVATDRVFKANRETESFQTIEECKNNILSRQSKELANYQKMYGQDYMDSKNYDLIIDSTYATPEEVAKKILECIDHPHAKFQMNPRSLYPTQNIRDLSGEILDQYVKKEIPAGSIKIGCCDGYFGVTDGHHRFLAAAINKEPFISAEFDPMPEKTHIVSKTEIYNYEDVAGFYYSEYPEDKEKYCLVEFCNESPEITVGFEKEKEDVLEVEP